MMAAMLLFIVIALILTNNLNERDTTSQISKAIKSIYDDRLIAEGYILQYMQDTHRVMEILENESMNPELKQQLSIPLIAHLNELNGAYGHTVLTEAESADFGKLKNTYTELEGNLQQQEFESAKIHSREAISLLEALSEIQLLEAERQMTKIDKLTSSTSLYFQLEVAVLIIIGAMIQALVFAEKSLKAEQNLQRAHMN